jgi:hypothetical protein
MNWQRRYHGVMAVKAHEEAVERLDRVEAKLREATSELERSRATLVKELADAPDGLTVGDLVERFGVAEDVVVAFVETVGELVGDRGISVEDARRAGMLAAAAQAWENELGPLLTSAQVRELLGEVSRQRVDELLRAQRLIGLRDNTGRRRFPTFQFQDGRPLEVLAVAFWTVAKAAASDWTAASWCVAPDDALEGRSPVRWARDGGSPERLAEVARQDAARLAR